MWRKVAWIINLQPASPLPATVLLNYRAHNDIDLLHFINGSISAAAAACYAVDGDDASMRQLIDIILLLFVNVN